MYIALGQRQSAPVDKILISTERSYHYPFVASFKETSLKSDFIHFFHDLIHVYSPGGRGHTAPRGQNVLYQQKLLVTSVICH